MILRTIGIMLISPEQLVEQIHDSPMRLVLAVAGGGSRAISDLLEVPGGSRTLLEAVVPYSAPAMLAWLGGTPDEFCSEVTARAMAMAAFQRARRFDEADAMPAGVACTASLATDRPKLGPHRIHTALQTAAFTAVWSLPLHKDRRTRAEEERLAGRLLLNSSPRPATFRSGWSSICSKAKKCGNLAPPRRSHGKTCCWARSRAFASVLTTDRQNLFFPGLSIPCTPGIRAWLESPGTSPQQPVFEMSILNVDKPPLDYMEIERRLKQFPAEQAIYLTRAATFAEKSRLFPGATFIVGADTVRRIAEPRIMATKFQPAIGLSHTWPTKAAVSWSSAACIPRKRSHVNRPTIGAVHHLRRAASFVSEISTCPTRCVRSAVKSRRKFFARTFCRRLYGSREQNEILMGHIRLFSGRRHGGPRGNIGRCTDGCKLTRVCFF